MKSPSWLEQMGEIHLAMCDIAWHTGWTVTLSIRGTHVNWTEISVDKWSFNIDADQGRADLIEWANRLRNREANAPLPEPRQRMSND